MGLVRSSLSSNRSVQCVVLKTDVNDRVARYNGLLVRRLRGSLGVMETGQPIRAEADAIER